MRRLLVAMMIMMMILCGCSKNDSGEFQIEKEDLDAVVEKESDGAQEEDGIIPYLAHSVINLDYDVIVKEDQQWDFSMNRLYKIVPLIEEGEFYDLILKEFAAEQLEGELFFVSDVYEINRYAMEHWHYDQTRPIDKWPCFWVMRDDPEAQILTIYEYKSFLSLDGLTFVDHPDTPDIRIGNRYIVDYSKIDEDDCYVRATEDFMRNDTFFSHDPYSYDGYLTVYEPLEEIPELMWINVKENNMRVRSTPEIRDDNKIMTLNATTGGLTDNFSFAFFVYEKTQNDGYTWYRIGKKRWIADDGTWIEEMLPGQE